MTETERQQIVKELKVEGRAAGFTEDEVKKVRYTPHSGQSFYLWKQGNNVVYIKELSPTIGFYGTAYETMRRWADHEIRAFANQQLPGWEYHDGAEGERKPSKSGDAVWFNLKPTTNPNGYWYERRANVIAAAWKLYRELRDKGIFDKKFNPRNYEGPMNNESTIEALLKANLNVILTGAPGTGKTYMAKEVAKEMAEDEWIVEEMTSGKKTGKWKNGRIASVQFHPGYDYSDFVVGMKPVLLDDKNHEVKSDEEVEGKTVQVSYRWKNGIFKEFATKARDAYDNAPDKAKAPKFVFLIDEINRADLSRVFGELFSLLEEEYRYPNDKGTGITLPNGEYFVIPRNLYILGTMNDIDRSVESMDFALRRRFAWFEVKAEDSMPIIDKKVSDAVAAKKLKDAMAELNFEIAGEEVEKRKPTLELRLGSEYQLGGAIFAKYEKYKKDAERAFDNLWNNHIANILSEYLRGRSNRVLLLKKLKEEVYDKKVKVNDKIVGSASGGDGAEKPSTEGSTTNDKQE